MQWILVCIVLTGFVSRSSFFIISGKLTQKEILESLDTHNSLRQIFTQNSQNIANMRQLKWDDDLEAEALRLASCDILGEEKQVESSSNEVITSVQPVHGINIAITSHHSIKAIIEEWFSQGEYYDLDHHYCQEDYDCSNFLQLVSANTHKLGCAQQHGCQLNEEFVKIFACVYSPGFDEMHPLFKVGSICSKCELPTSFCHNNLCVSCESKPELCKCRKTCRGPGGYGFLDESICSCTCIQGMGPNCDESCINPSHYDDWDVCSDADSSPAACAHPETGSWLRLFCPANCSPGCQNNSQQKRRKALSDITT